MKNSLFICLTSLCALSSALAHAWSPNMQDRYCGKLVIQHFNQPPGCFTCTMEPDQYYLQVDTRTENTGTSDTAGQFVKDHPTDLTVGIGSVWGVHAVPFAGAATSDGEIADLQGSVLEFLVEGKRYCVQGTLLTQKTLDPKVTQVVDFNKLYNGANSD